MWAVLSAALALAQNAPSSASEASSQPAAVIDDREPMEIVETAASLPVEAPEAAKVAQLNAAERARQLVAHGDALGRAGMRTPQLQAYRRALELDPRLANDPGFVRRFEQTYIDQRRGFAQQPQQAQPTQPRPPAITIAPPPQLRVQPRAPPPAQRFPQPRVTRPQPPPRATYAREAPPRNEPLKPREGRYLGVQFVTGPAAITGVGLTTFLFQHLQLSVVGDFWMPAISIDAKVHFLRFWLSPYVGGGVHFALPVNVNAPAMLDLYRTGYLYADAGLQYMSESGFYIDAGVAIAPGLNATPGHSGTVSVLPSLSMGWAWRFGRWQ